MSRKGSSDSLNEEEYLLSHGNSLPKKWAVIVTMLVIFLLILFVSLIAVSLVLAHKTASEPKAKNIILMITDGFGPASETFARNYAQHKNGGEPTYMLPLDGLLVGSSRTRSSDSLVTDSAAGATAFSCAIKTYNGAIAVDPAGTPCATVLEASKKQGMRTGLVATSRITHATPASFAAHVIDRDMENEIAEQEVDDTLVDVMFGGGRRHFIPQSQQGSARKDEKDLLQGAREAGYRVVVDRAGFDGLASTMDALPAFGVFTLSDITYAIDRNPEVEPSLTEMASKALSMLYDATKDQKKGFFLMIEGSRIDHAAHDNDAATHFGEIMEYQETIEMVKEFVSLHPDTVMISVSDHECGGLTVGLQVGEDPEYLWYPEVLDSVKNSTSVVSPHLRSYAGPEEEREAFVRGVLEASFGVTDPTDLELEEIYLYMESTASNAQLKLTHALSELINVRAHLGWTTHGHTGVDVNLYAYGSNADMLRGNLENTDIGQFIVDQLGLNLEAALEDLNRRRAEAPRPFAVEEPSPADPYHHSLRTRA